MKLKNQIIQNLISNGIANTTDHSVDPKHAYKVYTFRHEVLKAGKTIDDKRQELVKTAGIEDGQKFDERRNELETLATRTDEQQKEYDEMVDKLKRFGELYNELLEDETEINVKTIPYEEFHKLANENKQVPVQIPGQGGKAQTIYVDFYMAFRDALKDILWAVPEEDKE